MYFETESTVDFTVLRDTNPILNGYGFCLPLRLICRDIYMINNLCVASCQLEASSAQLVFWVRQVESIQQVRCILILVYPNHGRVFCKERSAVREGRRRTP